MTAFNIKRLSEMKMDHLMNLRNDLYCTKDFVGGHRLQTVESYLEAVLEAIEVKKSTNQ